MEITDLQKDLAATFRWTARLNMHEGVANHFSACVPGSTTDFYVNKAGIHCDINTLTTYDFFKYSESLTKLIQNETRTH